MQTGQCESLFPKLIGCNYKCLIMYYVQYMTGVCFAQFRMLYTEFELVTSGIL